MCSWSLLSIPKVQFRGPFPVAGRRAWLLSIPKVQFRAMIASMQSDFPNDFQFRRSNSEPRASLSRIQRNHFQFRRSNSENSSSRRTTSPESFQFRRSNSERPSRVGSVGSRILSIPKVQFRAELHEPIHVIDRNFQFRRSNSESLSAT